MSILVHRCRTMTSQSQTESTAQHDPQAPAQECVRHLARHAARSVCCNLGEVADLSLGGARILARSGMRSPIDVELFAMNKSVTVRAKVAWARPTGDGFKAEFGLKFPKLTRIQREVIESLSRGQMHRSLI
jgi:hypothetical protein